MKKLYNRMNNHAPMDVLVVSLLCLLIAGILGCDSDTPDDDYSLLKGIPYDAVKLEGVGTQCNTFDTRDNDCWLRWEYKGDCFMSRDLGSKYNSITRITCPDSINRALRIRNGKIIYTNQ
jgi:hypothetical protein